MTGTGRFEGRVAVVTGAAQGIGEAYARALAGEGASVVVADVDERGQGVADELKGLFVRTDVSDPVSVEAMAEAAVDRFGGIDHLVNNAAIFGTMKLDFLFTVDWDYYKRFMAVNMDGALLCARACRPHMEARGGGSIVNQSSTAAWQYSGFYGLAKVGVNGITQQLAHELGSLGIRVNAIAPGPIDTEANRRVVPGNMSEKIVQTKMALKRMGTPEDLVGACLFLLSDDAAWITGQIVNVDGGEVFRA
ncbi:SDR family oxidoreductase [Actinomadura fibrosa]|uniref:SDR family oxidoreductase n=1 Tax=Actinomadura fibrosa TaxID=111802 RepID=A0ABW2Y4L8_9ACTN|nr:SDR family oxidoreductase [Actinomadura fibrosa]